MTGVPAGARVEVMKVGIAIVAGRDETPNAGAVRPLDDGPSCTRESGQLLQLLRRGHITAHPDICADGCHLTPDQATHAG